jgi:hypothetical protein
MLQGLEVGHVHQCRLLFLRITENESGPRHEIGIALSMM